MRYTIGLREANHHLAKHIKAVEEGHEVIITRRGRRSPGSPTSWRASAPRTRNGRPPTNAWCG